MDEQVQALADLLVETGHAHHQAFIETNGADLNWALWYADYLADKLPHPSQCDADEEHSDLSARPSELPATTGCPGGQVAPLLCALSLAAV